MIHQQKGFFGTFRYLFLAAVLAFGLIAVIGSGGGDDGTTTTTTSQGTVYNSGGSIGDLLTYTIDTTAMTYSYAIIESDFGYTGTTGSGDLTKNADGTYAMSNDPGAGLILLPNTLVVGGAEINAGTIMLFAGVPALTTDYTAAEIAGTYNYISFECDDPLDHGACTAGYKSYYGTFKVDAGGTWKSCGGGDVDVQASTDNGDWDDLGSGLIEISSGGTVIGKAMLLPSTNGGKVIIVDFKDVAGVQGPGILVGVKKQDIDGEDLGGKYQFNDDDGGYGDVTVPSGADTYTGTQYDAGGNPTAISGTLTRNDPWNGWLTDEHDNLILILPGDGVFFMTADDPDNDWITIGGTIP
jgi:hypothetical protein